MDGFGSNTNKNCRVGFNSLINRFKLNFVIIGPTRYIPVFSKGLDGTILS